VKATVHESGKFKTIAPIPCLMMKMNMNINMSIDDDDDEDDGNGRWMTFTRGDDQEVLTDALHLGMCRLEDS